MNKRHYEHTLPNIRGSLSNTYVPISANSNPSVDGFLFALANSKVCFKLLEILSAALNALPGRSRDRVTPKS